jgi:2-octaprenyl-6-methoxyphenol hydroxylase
MQALSDKQFQTELECAFGGWLGAITYVGKRDVFPLKLLMADDQVYHRMALIGNASHTIHPIAGQGFNLGVRDVNQMAELIKTSFDNNQDIGQFSSLNKYASQRKLDHQQVIGLTDSLVTLFSNKLPPLVVGRNIGLKVLNYLSPLKNALVKKTMGY